MYGQGNVDGALQWGRLLIALWQWGCSQLYLCHTAATALMLYPMQGQQCVSE